MPKIIARGPNQTESVVELGPSGAVLLGRSPDAEGAARASAALEPIRAVTLSAPSISANHALAWLENDVVCVRDLGSKNGTWLLLPNDHTVKVGEGDVVLQLAQAGDDAAGPDEPSTPIWSGGKTFAQAIADSLERWLDKHGIEARVHVVAKTGSGAGSLTRIPLSSGEGVDIEPVATAHASWSRILERAWRWVSRQNTLFDAEEETRGEGLILASRALRAAHRDVLDAAQSGARTLLLTGPSGSGKERMAEVFHRNSGRTGPFIAVNCSMFSKELLRSELFGATAGSFTDAKQRILGAVERAQGGTLFLDEVGEMGPDVQPMLLRFLDRREFQSVGQYGRTQRADVRVVAATNRDLRDAVRVGTFRADLWYRLSVHVVDVPPLRTRFDDVLAYLASVPLDGHAGSVKDALMPDALEELKAHPWEGNFRELSNFVERLPRNASPGSIDVATCRRALERGALRATSAPPAVQPELAETDWSRLAARATQAFVEDRGDLPRTWDEQKEWNEKYLKPVLFFHMSGAEGQTPPADDGALSSLASKVATRLHADRGTAAKQLARYFERFRARG